MNAANRSIGIDASVAAGLTVQLQEIARLGPLHALTWAHYNDLSCWIQVSVQGGSRSHFMVQCLLPYTVTNTGSWAGTSAFRLDESHLNDSQRSGEPQRFKRRLDRLFDQVGWSQTLADARECLIYYCNASASTEQLLAGAEQTANRCAEAMRLLWQIECFTDIELLAARGPRFASRKFAVEQVDRADSNDRGSLAILPRAA